MGRAPFGHVHNYEVGEVLGSGGMGEIRIARHQTSGRIVAIKQVRKTLSLDPAVCARLTCEGQMLRLVDHPNVVSALDVGTDEDGQPYLVMSRAFGTQLDEVIAQVGAFSRNRISAIVSQLLGGLIAIHDAGVVHADLKASNVLLDEIDRITIIDFGLARSAPCDPTDDEVCAGTPAYMAPELFAGSPPSIAADIFAAGVIIYELLTGSPPLAPHLPAMLMWSLRVHESTEAPSLHAPARDISPALDAVLLRALARDPEDRFATVRELADALAVALAAWEPIHDEVTAVFVLGAPNRANLAQTVPAMLPSPEPSTLVHIRSWERVITDALEVAAERIAERDVGGAIKELEDSLVRLLAPNNIEVAAPVVGTAWRIETVLAALYQSTGKTEHASRMARAAQQHALLTECPVAEARTATLIVQLGIGRRMARGSGQAPLR